MKCKQDNAWYLNCTTQPDVPIERCGHMYF